MQNGVIYHQQKLLRRSIIIQMNTSLCLHFLAEKEMTVIKGNTESLLCMDIESRSRCPVCTGIYIIRSWEGQAFRNELMRAGKKGRWVFAEKKF